MSLQRKENNLRRAQARLDRVQNPPRWKVISHLKSREFQIDYRREPNRHGRYRTRAYIVRGAKSYHGNNRGLIHKAVNLKFRVQGDKPSVTRLINSAEPTTRKGKFFKKTAQVSNFLVHDTAQTAVDTALAAETVGLKGTDVAQREVRNKLKQKYTREAVDDYHRGVFLMGRTAVDAVKGTRNHLKTKKQYKLEKAKLQLQKADNKLFKVKSYRPKLCANAADLRNAKAQYKAKVVKSKGNKYRRAMNKRRLQAYKQSKRELKFERKQLKTEDKFRTKELKNQTKIAKASKPGLLALKPAAYTAERMKASAWQKAINEDQDNDFLHAVDSAKRRVAEPVAQKVSKPQRLQREEKKRDRLSDKKSKSNKKLNRQENRLNEKHDNFKKRKKKSKPANSKNSKKAKNTLSAAVKAAAKFVKNIYEKEVWKFIAMLALIVIVILLVIGIISMIFSATSSHSGFTLGTYAAQDYDLSEAEKYYTELAYNLNQKIRKVSDHSEWKNGLVDFGANADNLSETPDEWLWGQSSVYNWTPQYDFNCYKLWLFLCAYYYDFDADNDDIYYWEFDGDTEDLLEEIFNAEYEFVYHYDNTSHALNKCADNNNYTIYTSMCKAQRILMRSYDAVCSISGGSDSDIVLDLIHNLLKSLMNRSDISEIICATDADREGECIFRYVYNMVRCSKPVKRLWVSSLEESAIRKAISNMKPMSAYKCLFDAGYARAKADWLVGMNGSRLFSVRYGGKLNIGRVQTPTLAMIVQRDAEVNGFVKQKYYTADLNCGGFILSSARIDDESTADTLVSACDGKSITISSVKREVKTDKAPKLYDLTTLQREANKAFGYTAQQTLDYTQSLYEGKLVTYPRTDSQYLSDDMAQTALLHRSLTPKIRCYPLWREPEMRTMTKTRRKRDSALLPRELLRLKHL